MATEYNKMKVVELKAELKRLGLPQNGLKAELVARLEAAESESALTTVEETQDDGDSKPQASEEPTEEVEASAETKHEEEQKPAEAPSVEAAKVASPAAPPESQPPVATTDFAIAEAQAKASAPSTSSDATPVRTGEVIQDSQKRKRRSITPTPNAEDVARKRGRKNGDQPEDVSKLSGLPPKREETTEKSDTAMAAGVEVSNHDDKTAPEPEQTPAEAARHLRNGHRTDQTDAAMKEEDEQARPRSPQSRSNMARDESHVETAERDVEPAIHPATSALYIKNFMRPLRPQSVQDYLLDLATPSDRPLNDNTIVDFYLDTIRTHAFVLFDSISAASRVRTALHNRVWPEESTRKPLWVDFIPPENFNDWVDTEQASGGGRGSMNRYEVVYENDSDGQVTAQLTESGAAPQPVKRETDQPERKSSLPQPPPTGPAGIENAPRGPRGFQSGSSVHPSRAGRVPDDPDYRTTTAYPQIAYKPVSTELVERRIAALRTAKAPDDGRDFGKEYKRYFFEGGDRFVDRGPEIFLDIRPPPGLRERRREMERAERQRLGGAGGGPRNGGGGGGDGRRGPRGPGGAPFPMPHGIPRGGDRYRGAASGSGSAYGSGYDDRPRYGGDRGGDRYRGGDGYGRY